MGQDIKIILIDISLTVCNRPVFFYYCANRVLLTNGIIDYFFKENIAI